MASSEHEVELRDFERKRISPDVLRALDALHGETHDAVAEKIQHMLKNDLRHTVNMTDFENIVRIVKEEDEAEMSYRATVKGYIPQVRQFSQLPYHLPEITPQMARLVYQQMPRENANVYFSWMDYASHYEPWAYMPEIQRLQDILDERSGRGLFDSMMCHPAADCAGSGLAQVERIKRELIGKGGEIRDYTHLVKLPRGKVIASLGSMAGRVGAMLCGENMSSRDSMSLRDIMARRAQSDHVAAAYCHPGGLTVPAKPSERDAWANAHRQVSALSALSALSAQPALSALSAQPALSALSALSAQPVHDQSMKRSMKRRRNVPSSDSDDDAKTPRRIYKAKRPSKRESKPKEGGTRRRKSKFNKVKKSRKH
jgi:hypothetical protein